MADLRAMLLEELRHIAPEADYDLLDDDDSLRDELDLDSMDFLKFVQSVSTRTGVDVPELDMPQLDSIEGAIAYLEERL